MIHAGSHSRLKVFAQCKLRARYAFVDKVPEPDRGPPPIHRVSKRNEFANDRGNRLHDEAERFVQGKSTHLSFEWDPFRKELEIAAGLFARGFVEAETQWHFDKDWNFFIPEHRKDPNIFFRAKLDLAIRFSKKKMLVVDHKTGSIFGKEMEYSQQMCDYACLTALKYPDVETIVTELWMPDSNEVKRMDFRRAQALRFVKNLIKRMNAMATETEFRASPNKFSCMWCPYHARNEGPCAVGV